jgi:hypothetical protein
MDDDFMMQQQVEEQLHTDSLGNLSESYKAYERMNQEMDHVIQKDYGDDIHA